MLSDKELLHLLALQRVPNLGHVSAKKLLHTLGSATAIFEEKKSNLMKIDGIGELKIRDLHLDPLLTQAQRELHFIRQQGISVHYFTDPLYPNGLKHCHDSPILLYSKGNIDLQHKKIISIVGTRNASSHGIAFCEQLLEELAPLDPVIVSGFAYGIDITAQKKATQLGLQTIGCLAHGLDRIYPRVHAKYCSRIEAHGGFMTEFRSDAAFERTNFIKRNRIIAGICQALVVIESGEKGGSLVTADIANSYHREVFAVPGRPGDPMSVGCNNLLKTHMAQPITTAADLIYMMGWKVTSESSRGQQMALFGELSAEATSLRDHLLKHGKSSLDDIAIALAWPTHRVASLLLDMELKGRIRPLPGKQFEAI
ncbi:MAG: DNA-processing protein DprA [Bacteroidota bacterium]